MAYDWGNSVRKAVGRLAQTGAMRWLELEVANQVNLRHAKVGIPPSGKPAPSHCVMDEVFIFREFQTNHALSVEGKVEKVFHLPEESPEDPPDSGPGGDEENPNLSTVEEAHAARAPKANTAAKSEMNAAQRKWMDKIKGGDTS